MFEKALVKLLLPLSAALLAGGVCAQDLGKGGSVASGGVGPGGTQDASPQLEKCSAPKGTLAVVEPQSHVLAGLGRYGLNSPVGLIRMIIQQSNCFQIVERGAAMGNLMQERSLAQSGELQAGTNIGRGQMVGADFTVTPSVVFSENNAGGMGAAVGGLLGRFGGAGAAVGAIAGGLKFKEAQTSMLLVDVRSSIQVAAAEGSARQTDFALGAAIFGANGGGALGGYTNTNEGKVITASFLDNWNNIVRNIRDSASLIQAKAGPASQANAANSVQANAPAEGDVLVPRIAGAKMLRSPQEGAAEMMSLQKQDEVLYLGVEQNGYLKVTGANGDGWIRKVLVSKR
jgi:hypothetical protein